jgi:hypothetical protein
MRCNPRIAARLSPPLDLRLRPGLDEFTAYVAVKSSSVRGDCSQRRPASSVRRRTAVKYGARVPEFELTLFVTGVELLSDRTLDDVDHLGVEAVGDDLDRAHRALPYRGGDFFASFSFGRDGDVEYATCVLDAPSEDVAAHWAAAMLTHALPELRVVSVERGRHGLVDIR